MIKNFALITNTNSINRDLWECHFDLLRKYIPDTIKRYVFSDIDPEEKDVTFIGYDKEDKFRTQYLKCLKQVSEDYILYLNEDYLLYSAPDLGRFKGFVNGYFNVYQDISFIRVAKGIDNFTIPFGPKMFYLDCRNPYFFSQTAAVWRRSHLEAIHEHGPDLHIAGTDMNAQFEVAATDVSRSLGIQGFYNYADEEKRGQFHYDSNIFPYTASALVKGKWNFAEYEKELTQIGQEYSLDFEKRGLYL